LPPTATSTLVPSSTPTLADTATPTLTLTATPLSQADIPFPAASASSINIYFVLLNAGSGACGDRFIAVSSGSNKTGNIARDVKTALQSLFSYHQKKYGSLYNALGTSRFHANEVAFGDNGLIEVRLSGDFDRPTDACENTRVKSQIWATIKQFPEIKQTNIFLGNVPFGDLISNDG
jgi:hypothetical protein